MKESELNNKVMQALDAFDTIADITPLPDWSESLMARLPASKPVKTSSFHPTKLVVAASFFILLNIGYLLITIVNTPVQTISRTDELQAISKAILINPNSLNN